MLLTREKGIVALLLKHEEDKLTTTQIATSLKVSSRTIKTDIKKINEELESHSCRISSQQGVGLWIEYDDPEGKKYLQGIIQEEDDSYLSPEIRKYHLAVELLLQDTYMSMETLAQEYFISKATVLNDLSELDEFWNKFNLSFIKKVKYGIKVEGSESQKRSALIEAVKQSGGKKEVTVPKIQQHFEKVDLNQIRTIVNQVERRFQFVLTDPSVEELIIALAVMLERIAQGKMMNHSSQISQRESRKMNFVLAFMKERLTEEMEIDIPDEEDVYLCICLNGLRFHIPMEKDKKLESRRDRNPEMFDNVIELLMECDRKFYLTMEEDDELIGTLTDHLECMILRMNSKLYTYNPILDSIKNELFYEYEIASFFMSKFAARYKFEPTEDEIGFITFHMGASIERMKQKQNQKFTVTILCMTGFGTSQFLRVKLKSYFPHLEVNQVLSATRASQIQPEGQDFVITTVPIELENIPVIHVSPVLNETDIKKIQKFLMKKKENEPEEQQNYNYLKQFLHSEITILDCDLKSKEEVIHLLGGRMVNEGYTDEGFIDSVFERENLSETALGNLIAIPHAFEGHIIKQGIGLLTLKKPINWGDEKVQLIFLLSLGAPSKDYIKGIFGDVLELTKDKKTVELIVKAKKYADIFK
ncbi:MAG: BglG family transcription antiterminator [Hespellia sp.]|nr:BglG family transcription antiterminator [Hespellia sp.]